MQGNAGLCRELFGFGAHFIRSLHDHVDAGGLLTNLRLYGASMLRTAVASESGITAAILKDCELQGKLTNSADENAEDEAAAAAAAAEEEEDTNDDSAHLNDSSDGVRDHDASAVSHSLTEQLEMGGGTGLSLLGGASTAHHQRADNDAESVRGANPIPPVGLANGTTSGDTRNAFTVATTPVVARSMRLSVVDDPARVPRKAASGRRPRVLRR